MSLKNQSRLRRARQTRHKIREVGAVRLTVHRTNSHIYAQITSPSGDKVLVSASSTEKEVRGLASIYGPAHATATNRSGTASRCTATRPRRC